MPGIWLPRSGETQNQKGGSPRRISTPVDRPRTGTSDAGGASSPVGSFAQISVGVCHVPGPRDDGGGLFGGSDFGSVPAPRGWFARVGCGSGFCVG